MSTPSRHTALISSGLWCEFSFTEPGHLECTWTPSTPRRLTRSQLRRYRRARDAFVNRLAAELGVEALVVEV